MKVYSLAIEKRGLIAYDDKRVLLANLPNGEPNANTHVYGHFSLQNEVQVENTDEPAAHGNDYQVETREQHNEARFQRRHALAVIKARHSTPLDISDDDNDNAEVYGENPECAERAAAARQGASRRLNATIDELLTRMNVQRPLFSTADDATYSMFRDSKYR